MVVQEKPFDEFTSFVHLRSKYTYEAEAKADPGVYTDNADTKTPVNVE